MPYISTYGLIFIPLNIGKTLYKVVDQGWSEYIGGQAIYLFFKSCSTLNQNIQNNNFKIYLILFLLWIIVFIFLNYSNSLYLEYDTEDVMEII